MNRQERALCTGIKRFSLKPIISQLLLSYQQVAVKQHSFFVNDTPGELVVAADKNILCTLLGSVLYLAARCSRNSCIRIYAETSNGKVVLCVKDSATFNSYAVLAGLQHLQLLADKLGGVISIPAEKNAPGIIFSFPVMPVAA